MNMKKITILLVLSITGSLFSCQAQKLVGQPAEAFKLKDHKEEFIGKTLKFLLEHIKPEIKSALGNPEDASDTKLANVSFFFVDKAGYIKMRKEGKDPVSIIVGLKRADGKSYPPLPPDVPWNNEFTKTYGDMIVLRLGVLGKD